MRSQLTPNGSFRSTRGTLLAAVTMSQCWQSVLLGASEPPIREAASERTS
jgi:hypothetical protein